MKPLVSMILPSHDRRPVLQEVLSRLEPARQPFATEVIVIDNCSQDGSVAMMRADFPWVKLIALEENLGAVSRNLGIEQACGEYILMLDDDSYPLPGAIAGGVNAFAADRQGEIGCIAYNIQRPDGSFETAGICSAFTGCGAMFRASLFARIGGYPEDYLFYVEEYDVSCRIWAQGLRVVNPKDLQVMHLKTDVSRSFNRIMRQLVRNNMMLWSKYLPWPMAERQIEAELWRYHKIALKEDAVAGYDEGRELGDTLVKRFRADRSHELAVVHAERMLTLDTIRTRVADLAQHSGGRRVLLWNVGKQLYLVIEELQRRGWEVVGVVDANRHMQGDTYEGVPVLCESAFAEERYDVVLLGSSALAINDQLEGAAAAHGIAVPVVRMCCYDALP